MLGWSPVPGPTPSTTVAGIAKSRRSVGTEVVTASLVLDQLIPDPRDEWVRLLRFVGWSEESRQAAARSVEALFGHGLELVATIYEHLAQTPETAAILGWEHGPNLSQLEERRRFLTIWLARSLGLDT